MPSRASLLTPVGRGAVAVVAAEGDAALAAIDAHFRAANGVRLREQRLNRIAFGHWHDHAASNTPPARGEEMVVCRTGATAVEVHCHGGVAAAARMLATLETAGCGVESWNDWIAAHAADPIQAEADIALAAASTRRAAAVLLDQRDGALRREIIAIQLKIASDEATAIPKGRDRIGQLLTARALGLHLTHPWRVAIAGRPNVGKSSLLNALVGYQRAIVHDEPGTTRDVLSAETAIDGWPVRLSDAAGLRVTSDDVEAAGVELARNALAGVDLVLWVLDASALASSELADAAAATSSQMAIEVGAAVAAATKTLVVVNKSDLATPSSQPGLVATCAVSGAGLDSMLYEIGLRLVPHALPPGAAVPFTERQIGWMQAAWDNLAQGDAPHAVDALTALAVGLAHAKSIRQRRRR